jgi:hypothetical protein
VPVRARVLLLGCFALSVAVACGNPRPPTDPYAACDPVAQNCSAGFRCILDHEQPQNRLFCEAHALGQGVGEYAACMPSALSDNCDTGLVCLDDGTGRFTCRRFCGRDSDCASGGGVCALPVGATPFFACAKACSVLLQNCSSALQSGEACYVGLNKAGSAVEHCVSAGSFPLGAGCVHPNACQPGLLCSGDRVCQIPCDRDLPTCATPAVCVPVTGLAHLGVCKAP